MTKSFALRAIEHFEKAKTTRVFSKSAKLIDPKVEIERGTDPDQPSTILYTFTDKSSAFTTGRGKSYKLRFGEP